MHDAACHHLNRNPQRANGTQAARPCTAESAASFDPKMFSPLTCTTSLRVIALESHYTLGALYVY